MKKGHLLLIEHFNGRTLANKYQKSSVSVLFLISGIYIRDKIGLMHHHGQEHRPFIRTLGPQGKVGDAAL